MAQQPKAATAAMQGIMANSPLHGWSSNAHFCQNKEGKGEDPTKTSSYPLHPDKTPEQQTSRTRM